MVTAVQAWKTTDGQLFSAPEDADTHEWLLLWGRSMDKFFNSPYWTYADNGVAAGIFRKSIIGWERFKAGEIAAGLSPPTVT